MDIKITLKPGQGAVVMGMNTDRQLLNVHGIKDKAEYAVHGEMYGFRYEWGFNHYSFTKAPAAVKHFLGLSDSEYDMWDSKFIFRYNTETEEWYTDESIKTFERLGEV